MRSKILFSIPFIVVASLCLAATLALTVYLSPLNHRRPILSKPSYIILHTTEGGAMGSLSKLRQKGEAHYMIDTEGKTYQLIQDNRVAKHAGRSLWNGRPRLDEYSIGIEMVGFADKDLTSAQERSLAMLLNQLKAKFNISDDHVLTHSMVAYGVPNKWWPNDHRGRKRCGMLMADPKLRLRLGLRDIPKNDPDVDSKRLMVADSFLNSVLYGRRQISAKTVQAVYSGPDAHIISAERSAWFIARENYNNANTIYSLPDGRQFSGAQITNWNALPKGTRVSFREAGTQAETQSEPAAVPIRAEFKEIGIHGRTAFQIARGNYARETTNYFLPDGRVLTGKELYQSNRDLLNHLPLKTKVLVGYVNGGKVTKFRSAFAITKHRWNSPATIYRLASGQVMTGDEVRPSLIPLGTFIFFEQ